MAFTEAGLHSSICDSVALQIDRLEIGQGPGQLRYRFIRWLAVIYHCSYQQEQHRFTETLWCRRYCACIRAETRLGRCLLVAICIPIVLVPLEYQVGTVAPEVELLYAWDQRRWCDIRWLSEFERGWIIIGKCTYKVWIRLVTCQCRYLSDQFVD